MEQEYGEERIVEREIGYQEYLLERFITLSDLTVNLRKAYLNGLANREDHYTIISLAVELWAQIFPKVVGGYPDVEKRLRRYMPFYVEPKLFLLPDYEQYLFLLLFDLRYAFEKLGLTNIRGD